MLPKFLHKHHLVKSFAIFLHVQFIGLFHACHIRYWHGHRKLQMDRSIHVALGLVAVGLRQVVEGSDVDVSGKVPFAEVSWEVGDKVASSRSIKWNCDHFQIVHKVSKWESRYFQVLVDWAWKQSWFGSKTQLYQCCEWWVCIHQQFHTTVL